ncbi:peptidase family m28 domain-containing protein [Ditylenchus destructor]|nr:peptidase family m28 domain-containing protein [Ditylenchus destructor]
MDNSKTEGSALLRDVRRNFYLLYIGLAVVGFIAIIALVLIIFTLAGVNRLADTKYNHLEDDLNVTLASTTRPVADQASDVDRQFRDAAVRLLDYNTKGAGKHIGHKWLEQLVDDFGSRKVGSEGLDKAIDFTVQELRKRGFQSVHTEDVPDIPNWVRGNDQAIMIEPRRQKLSVLAIGGSPSADVTAEVIVLKNFQQLEAVNAIGKIVLFSPVWEGYGNTVRYRGSAKRVEEKGAVGLLVKSVTPFSIGTPHTGNGPSDATIPAACMTIEEAEMIERLTERGIKVVVQMSFTSGFVGKITSRNTIFEIIGSEKPNEVVLLSAHMDSWDVGQGAMDDGGGVAAVMQAMNSILSLAKLSESFFPKRTIRGVFWTAEEVGLLGAEHYYNTHKDNANLKETFFFVSETDQGAFRPTNFSSRLRFSGTDKQRSKMGDIVRMMNNYGIPLSVIAQNGGMSDLQFWTNDKVPGVQYTSDKGDEYYWYFHHTNADYMTVFKEDDIDFTSAIFAVMAHVIANMDGW